jgi:transposase-like protein
VWSWVQRFNPKIIYCRKTRVAAFIIDETMIQIGGSSEAWTWIAIEPVHSTILGVFLSRHRNMLVVESFLKSLIKTYGKHTVYSDGGGTWYPQACASLDLNHKIHTHLLRKVSSKGLFSISKIELRILMIITLV